MSTRVRSSMYFVGLAVADNVARSVTCMATDVANWHSPKHAYH